MINERGIINQFDVVVYPCKFVVAIGEVEKEINIRYKPQEAAFNWITRPSGDTQASTYTVVTKKDCEFVVLIWYKTLSDFLSSSCTHECNHAALEIFQYVGAKVTYDNQEPFCYLAGTLAKYASQTYWQYKELLDKKTKTTKKQTNKKDGAKNK